MEITIPCMYTMIVACSGSPHNAYGTHTFTSNTAFQDIAKYTGHNEKLTYRDKARLDRA